MTIETQPKSPPRVWQWNAVLTRQFAAIENDHLLLSTPDKTADRILRLPLQIITHIYIAQVKPTYTRMVLTALGLLAAATLPIWGPGRLGNFYHSDIVRIFAIPVAITVVFALGLSLVPATLILIVAGPRSFAVAVRLRRRKLDEFIDAISARIKECQESKLSGPGAQPIPPSTSDTLGGRDQIQAENAAPPPAA
ncbi:MAG: hypothetical protein ACP5O1_06545 [Phycisphaerae bacterium]